MRLYNGRGGCGHWHHTGGRGGGETGGHLAGAGLKRRLRCWLSPLPLCWRLLSHWQIETGPQQECRASVSYPSSQGASYPADWFLSLLGLCPRWRSAIRSEMNHSPFRSQPPPLRQQGSWVENPSDKVPSRQVSEYDAFPICWVLLHGTVGTLQPAQGGQQRMSWVSGGWRAGEPSQDRAEHGELTFLH